MFTYDLLASKYDKDDVFHEIKLLLPKGKREFTRSGYERKIWYM